MTLTPSDPPCVPTWLAAFVLLAGAAVGGVFGSVAGKWFYPGPEVSETGELQFRELHTTAGMVLGAGSGVAVAVGWSLRMRRFSVRTSGLKVITAGACFGAVAGALSAVILHVSLSVLTGGWPMLDWVGGMVACAVMLGVPAGLVTGLVCGIVAWAAAAIARRARAPAAPPPSP